MARHISFVCDYLERELSRLRGVEFEQAICIMEQAIRNAERQRKNQESYDRILQKLEKCSTEYARIDLYHNQKFERSISLLWNPAAPVRCLLERLRISVLMFVCSNMVASELGIFTAFKDPRITAELLNNKYGNLPIPEAVWKKAKSRLDVPQIVYLDAHARREEANQQVLNLRLARMLPKKELLSPRIKRDRSPDDAESKPPMKRVKLSPSSMSKGQDGKNYFCAQTDYAQYTALSMVTVVEFMLSYREWPEVIHLITPKDFGICPFIQLNPVMYALLIECAKTTTQRD